MSPWRWMIGCSAVVLVVGASAASAASAVAGPAPGGPAGEAIVLDADGEPLTGGGGSTPFSLGLPEGAACPGDSANDQYRVQSFLVPADADPATLRFLGQRPQYQGQAADSDGGWALYELNTNSFLNRPTDLAPEPGAEGTIINLPSFSFDVFDPGMLPEGRVEVGIACSRFAETERYWSAELELVADPADAAGVAWSVLDPPTRADEAGSGPAVGVGLALAVAASAGFVLVRRRSERAAT